ncbi:LysR family transcriptional regulator [Pullulanibacillus sp. KACC 23026]|uniref:cidABC operon transcriptional activator CidR n=1 Tax=Pullulanibacillus sp. KACC 23026 TaxID=3028315 RepID=UPI0023B0AEDC|nr:LysR family transcriptional regulator [Pullulanibacillus sp. KACC 23026]WEG14759.1 LysR family transcriptional regulator [Pullulanibacillus sp. KACC 23026]
MDIRHLIYFLEVAHRESFTKAANHLFVTQPTISKMVKNLEDEFGVELFDRTGKRVQLTDAGHIILKHAEKIIHSFQNMTHALDDLRDLKTGSVRIGLPPMIGSRFFPKIIGGFREQFPGITIQLVENGAKKVEEEVGRGLLDIGVILLPTDEELFNTYSFVKEELRLIVHPSHPLSGRKVVKLSELKEDPFILFREDFALHDRIINACLSVGFQPVIASESSQWDLISEMVAANLGIALLPETICAGLDPLRVKSMRLIDPIILWQLAIVWRKDHYLPFAAREWIRYNKTILKEV